MIHDEELRSSLDYSAGQKEAAYRILIELINLFDEYRDDIRIVGGWVPDLMFPGEGHIGSVDVDILINHLTLQDAGYLTMSKILLRNGYREHPEKYFSFIKTVDIDGEKYDVDVDILAGMYGGTQQKKRSQHVQGIKALKATGGNFAFTYNPQEIKVEAKRPDGAYDTAYINVIAVVPYFVMKTAALGRGKPKDAYDLYFLIKHYQGGIDALAELFASNRQTNIVSDMKKKLDGKFASPEHAGPADIAAFMDTNDEEEIAFIKRDAYERLKSYADHVFLMTGNNSKKEHRKILDEMQQVQSEESLILVATGKLIGEGFDFPRLDTLIMATPVSFKGVVEQYAGRLNRDYDGKEKVIVYDYVDSHIPMFDNMYAKRLKAYKQIGYDICSGLKGEKQTANAIYNCDNYQTVYLQDLLDAAHTIVISSPAISGKKVNELISILQEQQSRGVTVTIVTWEPDAYDFGDASYWMQLHEEMRQAGFYMKLVDDYCEHFAIIDQEIVWYGSINLLANSKLDDSLMRVISKRIASELMEMTFG